MSVEKIINDIKAGKTKPVYWLEGDEEFFIDQVINYAEHHILTESEAGFNLSVFYGRDTNLSDLVNSCRRYPMFSEKQVVIVKEAQALKDIEKLESYVENPLGSTLLFIAYKNKKVDGRTKFSKALKDKGVVFTTKKLWENELPDWTNNLLRSKGFTIDNKALVLLIDHIGNDLSRMNNEIEKLALNLEGRKNINDDDIEKYVGISKEFNVFELQHAIASRDLYKAVRIIQYFDANPKAGPIQMILPALYSYFSKVMIIYSLPSKDANSVASAIGVTPFRAKEFIQTAVKFSQHEIEKVLLLLYEYNLRNLGINDSGTEDADLLKEMVVKMLAA
jgi:DNA polymerase III subunit delta